MTIVHITLEHQMKLWTGQRGHRYFRIENFDRNHQNTFADNRKVNLYFAVNGPAKP